MVTLTPENMEDLTKLVETIKNVIGAEKELDRILDLSGKLNGTLGEAIGLAKLYGIYGSSANYDWRGKQKKGYDVQVTEKGEKPLRFQIKASAQEKYVFRPIKVTNLDSDKIRIERENKKFLEISERIKEAINQAQTDVWLFIHAKKDNQNFIWIEKEDMIKVVTEHYENAVKYRDHTKSKKGFHGYVDKNNIYRPIITQKEQKDRDLLNRYNRPPRAKSNNENDRERTARTKLA